MNGSGIVNELIECLVDLVTHRAVVLGIRAQIKRLGFGSAAGSERIKHRRDAFLFHQDISLLDFTELLDTLGNDLGLDRQLHCLAHRRHIFLARFLDADRDILVATHPDFLKEHHIDPHPHARQSRGQFTQRPDWFGAALVEGFNVVGQALHAPQRQADQHQHRNNDRRQ